MFKYMYLALAATMGYIYHTTVPSKTKKLGGFKELQAETGRTPAYDETYYPGSAYADLPFGKTHYNVFGPADGRRVVWICGITTPATGAAFVLRALAHHGYRILTYDYYGRGYSESPGMEYTEDLYVAQLALLLQQVGWTKASVLGVSMGGAVAAAFTAKFPHLVDKMGVICPAGLMDTLPRITKLLPIPVFGDILGFTLGRRLMLANTDARITGDTDKDEVVRLNDKIVRQQLMEHPGFMRAYLSTVRRFPFTSLHSRFEAAGAGRDVLIVWGTEDTVVPYQCSGALMQVIPHAKLVTMKGATHAVVHDRCEDVAKAIIDFLDNAELSTFPRVSSILQESWIAV
ncbi:hypothetical protein SeMB42_g04537 [Synchytrium endobioticum]|uniref:AB hydrolase-1 domain-containing protein n=1 Tax=Synchytrium endobioticum TaxID=286115 RepID=A0A507CUQ1_9FUNG|nr:hypothetical protein SeLEV6574_g05357 [Synchytrium endobioticum]TPX43883.1 hypothetical protein SeMB42_g04537 [Synchytrium endobioticum]